MRLYAVGAAYGWLGGSSGGALLHPPYPLHLHRSICKEPPRLSRSN